MNARSSTTAACASTIRPIFRPTPFAGRDLGSLVVETLLERLALELQTLRGLLELRIGFLVLETDFEPLFALQLIEILGGDLRAGLELLRSARDALPHEQATHTLEEI